MSSRMRLPDVLLQAMQLRGPWDRNNPRLLGKQARGRDLGWLNRHVARQEIVPTAVDRLPFNFSLEGVSEAEIDRYKVV